MKRKIIPSLLKTKSSKKLDEQVQAELKDAENHAEASMKDLLSTSSKPLPSGEPNEDS